MSFLVCHNGSTSPGARQAVMFSQNLHGVEVKEVDVTNSPNWYGLLEMDSTGAIRLPQTFLIDNNKVVSVYIGVMGINEANQALSALATLSRQPLSSQKRRRSGQPFSSQKRRRSGRPDRPQAGPRGTLYVIHADWCGACQNLFNNHWDRLRSELEANRVQCVTYESNHDYNEIADLMGGPNQVRAYPTFVVTRPNGSVATQFPGYNIESFVNDVVGSLN